MSHHHSPPANETNEHYCMRCMSLEVLKSVSRGKKKDECGLQISNYTNEGTKYLVFSSATRDPFKDHRYRGISVGLLINRQLQRKLNFLGDPKIANKNVGVTCEHCFIKDCKVRQAPAIILYKALKNKGIELILRELNTKFHS